MTRIALEEIESVRIGNGNQEWSDSRRRMPDLTKIAKALGLKEDTDEAAILEALKGRPSLSEIAEKLGIEIEVADGDSLDTEKLTEAVKTAIEEGGGAADEKSLEDRAKEEGKQVVENAEFAELKRDAAAGKKAADELHQAKFDTAFDKALSGVRVDAKDETRERYQKLYDADAEATLELLENLPKLARTDARGSGGTEGDVPDGVDEDRAKLDRRVKAYMREHDLSDYAEALDKVLAEDEDKVPA
jgi:hypothetical protein